MSWQVWAALAGALTALRVPGRSARLDLLAGAGRLDTGPGRRSGPARRPPWPRIAAAAIAAATLGVLLIGGVLPAITLAVGCAAGAAMGRDVARRRDLVGRMAELRTSLRVLMGELEAGARPAAALVAAAQAAPRYATTFGAAATAAAHGGDAAEVLLTEASTRPIGLAWQLSEETGLELAAVLDRVAGDLRAQQDQRHTVEVALSGPRASALLLSGLPVVGIALGSAMGARPLAVLIGGAGGQALGCAGLLLDVAGLLWMRRILSAAERT